MLAKFSGAWLIALLMLPISVPVPPLISSMTLGLRATGVICLLGSGRRINNGRKVPADVAIMQVPISAHARIVRSVIAYRKSGSWIALMNGNRTSVTILELLIILVPFLNF
jgi:hypothetical protein